MATPDIHIHIPGLVELTVHITRLEQLVESATAQIEFLGTRINGLTGVVTSILADFTALLAILTAEQDTLSPTAQAAVDSANSSLDANSAKLAELNTAVGDADGDGQ